MVISAIRLGINTILTEKSYKMVGLKGEIHCNLWTVIGRGNGKPDTYLMFLNELKQLPAFPREDYHV